MPSFKLSLIVAACDKSSSVLARTGSLPPKLTPPIKSDSFSFFAKYRALALVAPFSDSANTEEPRAAGLVKASACIEINKSALNLRAFTTRVPSGIK